jgi:hydroxymethylglutaryl-CoA reductase
MILTSCLAFLRQWEGRSFIPSPPTSPVVYMAQSRAQASAPNKVIIAGEHSVVYGGLALSAPVEVDGRRNVVTASGLDEGGISFSGDLGTASLVGGKKSGSEAYFPYLDGIAGCLSKAQGARFDMVFSHAPKGTGNSASIAAASILAASALAGKKLSPGALFERAFEVDNAVHGGRSSGIDPATVCSDSPIEFCRTFGRGKISARSKPLGLSLPAGTALLLVDSSRGKPKESTAQTTGRFASYHSVTTPPAGVPQARREAIAAPFDAIVRRIETELTPQGDADALGQLFDANHSLLGKTGVSSPGIEKVITLAKRHGALGAKLSGGGGEGGAVLALVRKAASEKLGKALLKEGYASYSISFARKGARLEEF